MSFTKLFEAAMGTAEQQAGYKKYETEVNSLTEEFLKKVQALLKGQGYKYSSRKASATIQWGWEKGEKTIGISGWHGTGGGNRNYGTLKMIMGLHITETKAENFKSPFGDTKTFVQPGKKADDFMAGMPNEKAHYVSQFDQATADKSLAKYKEDLDKAMKLITKRA